MSTVQPVGPRVANVVPCRNNHYYPINGLLDELDMLDKQERLQFKKFLKDFLTWDKKTKQGYKRDEHAALPDSDMSCYAKQFLDQATIKLPEDAAEPQNSKAGEFYFPRRDIDEGSNFSQYPKRWNYFQHRDSIIEVVSQIMVTQKRNVSESLRQKKARKTRRAEGDRRKDRRNPRAALRQQDKHRSIESGNDSDSNSNFSSNAALPTDEHIQQRTSSSIPYQSAASSSTNARHSSTSTRAELAQFQLPTHEAQNTTKSQHGNSISESHGRTTSISEADDDHHRHTRSRTVIPTDDPMLPRNNDGQVDKTRLKSWIEGVEFARKYCMQVCVEQQIAARLAGGLDKQHLIAKADGILDTLQGLDETLKGDKDSLRRFVGIFEA